MTSCGSLRYKIEEQGKRETQEVQAWFVLNMEKGILFCSRDLNSTLHPTFALVVTQYEISTSVNRNHNGSQLFGWMTWGNNEFTMMGKERKLTFYAKGEEDRNGWLTVLNHVTQRGKRRVNTWALPETKRVGDVVGIIPLEVMWTELIRRLMSSESILLEVIDAHVSGQQGLCHQETSGVDGSNPLSFPEFWVDYVPQGEVDMVTWDGDGDSGDGR